MSQRFDADQVQRERRARIAEQQRLREQILRDQRTNAKRDEKALERERAWRDEQDEEE